MNEYENRLREEYERIVKIKDSTIRNEELKKLCSDYRNEIYDTYNSSKSD